MPEEFAADVVSQLKKGVRVAGGCCGTTPDYIAALVRKAVSVNPKEVSNKNLTVVSSYTHTVCFLMAIPF